MIIVKIIDLVLLGIFFFFLGYLALLSILALKLRNKTKSAAGRHHKFAVVIPAHNEEKSIIRTLKSLQTIEYPKDKHDIYVIADNCTDATASIARKEGAIVLERTDDKDRGKGYALRWYFEKMLSSDTDYEAFFVLDADSIAFPNMLEVVNRYVDAGGEVIQGYLAIEPKIGFWSSEITRLGYTLNNNVRSVGRSVLGCPSGLKGNGMCLSRSVLETVPWQAFSLTEDLEYGLILLLNGIDVKFASEKIGYSSVPETVEHAESQRERWEIGRYPLVRKYTGKIFRRGLKERSWKFFDAFIDLVMLPLVNMLVFVAAFGLLNLFLGIFIDRSFLNISIAWFSLILLGLLHLWLGLYATKSDAALYKAIFYVPKYAVWKLYLYLKIILKGRSKDWIRTAR